MPRALALLPLLLLGACAAPDGPAAQPWPEAAGDVADPELAALARDVWAALMDADPIEAGALGDEAALARVPDVSAEGRAAHAERLEALLERQRAIRPERLDADDRVTWAMAGEVVTGELVAHEARLWDVSVSPRRAPHVWLFNLAGDQPVATPREREALLERWSGFAGLVDATIGNLRAGLARGRVANETSIRLTLDQLGRILEQPVEAWPLADLDLPGGLSPAEARLFEADVVAIVRDELRPAFVRYRDLLRDELLPAARSDEAPGLSSLPGGARTYARLIRMYTSLDATADELHAFGLQEVARIRGEMSVLGSSLFGIPDVGALQEKLRTDPELHFSTRDEVELAAVRALARARRAMGAWFGRLPEAPCEVVRIGEHEERETTIAYYRGPTAELPGRYFINTYAPHTRPRYDAEVLAYHEAIPGHHLQIAIAQELEGVPLFQRHAGSTAFVEGWALYSERLSDEMGLYSSDLDRLGMLSFDAWRACRLVVDTGLHAFGWSRARAIDYLHENTLLSLENVRNEVDRYITTPAQALAYKSGQREILALRAQAEAALGDAFAIEDFHDVVLGHGAVTLPVLRDAIERWIASADGAPAGLTPSR